MDNVTKKKQFDIIAFLTKKSKYSRTNVCENAMLSYYKCIKNTGSSCEKILSSNEKFRKHCTPVSSR